MTSLAYLVARADAAAEQATREAPDRWWCPCGWHRARRDGGLCPVCEEDL